MSVYGAYRNLGDHPKPGIASAEASTLSGVSSSESPAVNPPSDGDHSGPPRAAPPEISVAADMAAVAAKIGITRVVQDDRAPRAGAAGPGPGAGVGRRFCGGGVAESSRIVNNVDPLSSLAAERSAQENLQRGTLSGYDGGRGSSVQQLTGASVPQMSAPAVGELTVRGGNEDRRLGSDTRVASGPQSSILPTGHDGIAFGTQGGYDESDPFGSSQCPLTQALLGEDSGEENMWGLGSDDMGLAP